MLRTGFGAKTAKSLSSTGGGKQNVSDRGSGADGVIRSIAGVDMAVWIDIADVTGFADGDKVAEWSAKVGTGPAQSDVNKKPLYKDNGFNNRPSLFFDNSNDCLTWGSNQINAAGTSATTIVSVSNTSSTGANSVIFEVGGAYWAGQYAAQFYNTSEDAVSAEGPSGAEGTVTATTQKDNVFISAMDRATNPDAIVPYINGEPAAVESETTANNTNDFLWNTGANLGSRQNGGSLPLNGDIREFLIINRFLAEDEACRLGKALMNKCGLTDQYVA
tara:strand:- start:1370 stop:2194 length:825 start_codon:yes stop_codon:yes gene_type:complete